MFSIFDEDMNRIQVNDRHIYHALRVCMKEVEAAIVKINTDKLSNESLHKRIEYLESINPVIQTEKKDAEIKRLSSEMSEASKKIARFDELSEKLVHLNAEIELARKQIVKLEANNNLLRAVKSLIINN